MRRNIFLVLALALTLFVAGCSSHGSKSHDGHGYDKSQCSSGGCKASCGGEKKSSCGKKGSCCGGKKESCCGGGHKHGKSGSCGSKSGSCGAKKYEDKVGKSSCGHAH